MATTKKRPEQPDKGCALGFEDHVPEHIPAPAGGGRPFQLKDMRLGYRVLKARKTDG
jgi:hypothetical protein